MSDFLYSLICLIKFYLLYASCKLVFMACYKICAITDEQSKLYHMLYQQNKSILERESFKLLASQIIEQQVNNVEKNKSILSSRLSQIDLDGDL